MKPPIRVNRCRVTGLIPFSARSHFGALKIANFSAGFPRLASKFARTCQGSSDFQSEVGEVFGEIGGELPAKFGRRFSSFFCWENRQKHFPPKFHRKFHHQTSLRGSGLWWALHV